ncbi:MAG: HNH endonuclease [Pyrinomonadaceae bacterium]
MADKSKRHFCGFACYGLWQREHRKGVGSKRVSVACYVCGKAFEKQPSAVVAHNFCGRACFAAWRTSSEWTGENNPAWLGGHTQYRGENWNRQRKAARKRDNDTCQHCGTVKANLPVHHKRPFYLFDNYREANRLTNLVSLCPSCHTKADLLFWREHPELRNGRQLPDCVPARGCRLCGEEFKPRSGATAVCDKCCTNTCVQCREKFYSRKAAHREVKYCSRACRNAHVKLPVRACAGCGASFQPDRPTAKFCSQPCHMTKGNPRRQFFSKRKHAVQD